MATVETPAPSSSAASPFEPEAWKKKTFTEKLEIGCHEYVFKGLAYPPAAYIFHAFKLAALFAGWVFFCSFTPGFGWGNIGAWAFDPTAFQKAFIWGLTFETLGMGCMCGPLGLRLWPPFTAFLHYLRPGTTKLPLFPGAPIIGGTRRTWLDVALYTAFVISLFYALIQPEVLQRHLIPIVALLPLCALGDRVIFLSARGEHHFAIVVTFLLAGGDWIGASKWVQLAIWFWAGVSKLTPAFAYVVPIMTANNPFLKIPAFRKKLFVSYPDDLSPSTLGKIMAHMGTFLELGAPLALVWVTQEGPMLYIGLVMMVMLHGFILSNMPIAAVFEWNILSAYAGFFLFYFHPEASLFDVGGPICAIYLIVGCLIVPLLGNLVPRWISFLLAMRYYAGNWAWNAWLIRTDCLPKLDKLKRASKLLVQQQERFLPADQAAQADGLFLAFRALHLQGRVLGKLLPQTLQGRRSQDYTYCDGEMMAGSIVGWNFGEGHLSDERLLTAIQQQCGFEEGEIRVICVEAQPILKRTLHWRINDAKTGRIAEGHVELSELAQRKPWDCGGA